MKRILGMTALVLLLAACAPAAPSADDSAVQTAVAALLTQQAPAATEATQVEETAPDLSGGAPTSIVPTTESFPGLPAEATCVPLGTDRVYATVVDVPSGDEAYVQIGDQRFYVRYIGVDDGNNPSALEANRALIEGKQVVLVRDVSDVDQYGRLVRYVMVDDAFVNLRLLQDHQVFKSIEEPDTACERLFNSIP
ncbi:MAG: hypothetical protein KF828_07770 [Anaerolineales bacterium]|nr:hypothetical protein [Anaerolineales bacterium]